MPWWGWVLIVVGVVAIGYLKLSFFKKWKEKQQNKNKYKEEDN